MPLIDYLPESNNLPDQFEPDEGGSGWEFVFPCCACKHRGRTGKECEGCAHYIN